MFRKRQTLKKTWDFYNGYDSISLLLSVPERQRQAGCLNSRSVWCTYQVPGQPPPLLSVYGGVGEQKEGDRLQGWNV